MNKFISILAVGLVCWTAEAGKVIEWFNQHTNAPVIVVPTNIPPVIVPSNNPPPVVTNTPPVWGDAIEAPYSDLSMFSPGKTKEWRIGSNPEIRVLAVRPDYFLGTWIEKAISRKNNGDGTITFTMVPVQGPSGNWYVPYSWRLKTESSAMIMSATVTAPQGDYGSVTRARFECHKGTGSQSPPVTNNPPDVVTSNIPPIIVKNGKLYCNGEDITKWGTADDQHPYPPAGMRTPKKGECQGEVYLPDVNSNNRYIIRGYIANVMHLNTVGSGTGVVIVEDNGGKPTKWWVQ